MKNHMALNGTQKTRNANLRNLFSNSGHGIIIILYITVVHLNYQGKQGGAERGGSSHNLQLLNTTNNKINHGN